MLPVHRLRQHFVNLDRQKASSNQASSSGDKVETPETNVSPTSLLPGERERRLLARMSREVATTRRDCDQLELACFRSFLDESAIKVNALIKLDKSKRNYKDGLIDLEKEFGQRIIEISSSNQPEKYEEALLSFLDDNFSFITGELNPGNVILATMLLRSDQQIVADIIKNFLVADESNVLAKDFLDIVQSAKLSEDPKIFWSLFTAAVEGINEDSPPAETRKRIVENLLRLSPGKNLEDRVKYLFDESLQYEQGLLEGYESVFNSFVALNDDDDDTELISNVQDVNELFANLEDDLVELKYKLIDARHFINGLYKHKDVQAIISGENILDLLEQSSPLDSLNVDKETFNELLEALSLDNEHAIGLFNPGLLVKTLQTAFQFSKQSPSKLNNAQIQAKIESVIEKLGQHSDFYIKALTTAIQLYSKRFTNSSASTFLMRLVENPDTEGSLRYRVVEKIADSEEFQLLLRSEMEEGKRENLAALFSIADKSPGAYKPLQTFLAGLSNEEFIHCVNKLDGATLTSITTASDDDQMEDVVYLAFSSGKFLSIITKQFDWTQAEDPISRKLVNFLNKSLGYDSFIGNDTEIGKFLKYFCS